MRRYDKRGAVDVQLNWVFILIAGTIILTFFFAVIQKQKSVSERKIGVSLTTSFDGIFTSALSSSDTLFTMPVPEEGVAFECTDTCDCRYRVGTGEGGYQDKMMFAAPHVPGPSLTLWAMDFDLPFQIATYLFITSPQVQYVFSADSSNANLNEVLEVFPRNLTLRVEPGDLQHVKDNVENNNFGHTVFVFFGGTVPQNVFVHDTFRSASTSAIHVSGLGTDRRVTFYRKPFLNSNRMTREANSATFAPNTASLLGAIFAADKNMYRCNYGRTMQRVAAISAIYGGRALELASRPNEEVPDRCLYVDANATFGNLGIWARDQFTEPDALVQRTNVPELDDTLTNLDVQNQFLLQQSCPVLY